MSSIGSFKKFAMTKWDYFEYNDVGDDDGDF